MALYWAFCVFWKIVSFLVLRDCQKDVNFFLLSSVANARRSSVYVTENSEISRQISLKLLQSNEEKYFENIFESINSERMNELFQNESNLRLDLSLTSWFCTVFRLCAKLQNNQTTFLNNWKAFLRIFHAVLISGKNVESFWIWFICWDDKNGMIMVAMILQTLMQRIYFKEIIN